MNASVRARFKELPGYFFRPRPPPQSGRGAR
ncbi:MAG: hypothetical protein RLZZ15_1411, partial [Verrucomicrobiota bacterium]